MQDYPEVNIQVEYRHPDAVYEDVLSNVVDLGLLTCPRSDRRLELIPLRKDRLVFVCSPQHPLAKSKSVNVKALKGMKFISFEKEMDTRYATDRYLKDSGVTVENVNEFDNIETIKRAVEIDAGAALLPETTIKLEVANRTLIAIPFEPAAHWPIGLIHKKGRVLSPALKKFIALVRTPL